MQRRPGESIQEPAARIRQAAATCDFASIADRLDDALRTRFICTVNNGAVLKAIFNMKADELDFTTAIQVAIQTEDPPKLRRRRSTAQNPFRRWRLRRNRLDDSQCFSTLPRRVSVGQQRCYRCGNSGRIATSCKFKDVKCNFCKLTGQ